MRYLTLDVFTATPFGGNQLAVFPDATGIPEELLLPITREFNFSEVTFVYPAADAEHTRRVRIFTPEKEMPFAGHPTIGTAAALALVEGALDGAQRGTLRLDLKIGTVPVDVRIEGEALAWAELSAAKMPEVGPSVPTLNTMAEILSLDAKDLVGGALSPQAVSCGYPFLLVPLKTVDAVQRARVRVDLWEQTLKRAWAPEILVAARDAESGEQHWRARMFAPGINVPEDPATGSAIAAFGGWLAMKDSKADGEFAWTVRQGIEMGRPSLLEVRATKAAGAVTTVRVAGRAVLIGEGTLRLPTR
ncbi:MAG: PhzF family phenazine biosynthesis protein [Gemmatimonadaceae bacterium]|nr:PhzF family phenazine biosynthesis protein [Gemmatimonadaceae bacterium]MCW5826359.1 PhzF family phenazine biosynthesis protein [Gemmatimonadaceae bacterium]